MQNLINKAKTIFNKIPSLTGLVFVSWFGVETPDVPKLMGISDVTSAVDVAYLVINLVGSLGSIVAIAMILYGGFLYVSSNGDQEKTQAAQGTITNALIGLVVLFIIGMIIRFVANLTVTL
jgi:uncharacterized membrane protein